MRATESSPYRIHVRRGASVVTHPRTSIIALVTNDTTLLTRCLSAVEATASPDDPPEIVVLANGTPAHALTAFQRRDDIVLITSPVNHGFSGGCNLAARCALGTRLVFLNDDVTVTSGWLDVLHRALDEDPGTAVAGSKVLLSADRLQEAGCVLWSDGSTSGVGRGRDPREPQFSATRPVDYVSFCCAMVRRSAWYESGGFDERYFPAYYEDVDLCLTLHRLGWKVMYEPNSVVNHAEGSSATRDFRDFLSRRNRALFVDKWGPALVEFEDPPATEADRAEAEQRALRRAARRAGPARPATAAQVGPKSPQAVDGLGDVESLVIEVRHLSAALAVTEAYAHKLSEERSTFGLVDVVRRRLHPIRVALQGQLRSLRSGRRHQ